MAVKTMMFFENLCCINAENRHLRPRSIVLIKFGWVMAVIRYIHERPIINRVMLRLQSAVIDTLRVFAVPLISSLADSHLLNANVERTSTVHCQRQELSDGVLCECKASAIITHLTLVPYGTDTLKTALFRGDLDTLLFWHMVPRAHQSLLIHGISIASSVFAQLTIECPYDSQWARKCLPNCPSPHGIRALTSYAFAVPLISSLADSHQ